MRVLFVLLRPKYANVYEPTLRVLARRGHEIHLTFTRGRSRGGPNRFALDPGARPATAALNASVARAIASGDEERAAKASDKLLDSLEKFTRGVVDRR